MASKFDLAIEEGLEAFRTSCKVPGEVLTCPFMAGEDRPKGSVMISSYML